MRARLLTWETAVLAIIVVGVAAPVVVFTQSVVEFFVMPDELGYVKQAVMLGRAEPQTPGDFWFNSWAQLAPLLYAPFYRAFPTPTAFDLAHVLNAFVFASAAIPVWLLARRVLGWATGALIVAACSIAVPWAGMAGTVMTEPVAYAASCWAVLAMAGAIARPGVRADLLALAALGVAFFARTQLIILAPALLAAIAAHELLRPGGGSAAERLRAALRTHILLAVVVPLAALAVVVAGGLDEVLGSYIAPAQRTLLPDGTFAATREMVVYVVLGIAVLPLPFTAAWVVTTLGRGARPDAHALACLTAVIVPVLAFVAGAFTVGFAAGIHDRYLFYIAPLLLTGMLAVLLERPRGWVVAAAVAGAGSAALVGTSALTQRGPSLTSPSTAFHEVLPGPEAIAVGVAVALAAILVAAIRVPNRVLAATVGVAVLAYGVIETQYTLRAAARTQAGASEEFRRMRDWIDRALPARARAASVIAAVGDPLPTSATWYDVSFWNKSVERVFRVAGAESYSQGFTTEMEVDPQTGRIPALDRYRFLVRAAEDARFGLRRSTTVAIHGGLAIIEAERPYRAEWFMEEPESIDGELAPGRPTNVRVFPPPSGRVERVRIDMRVRPVGSTPQTYTIVSGTAVRRGRLYPGNRSQVDVPVDLTNGPATIRIESGRNPARLRLLSVLPVR